MSKVDDGNGRDSLPWYRYPWVWLVVGLPLASVVASFTVMYLAITHRDDLVRDDWYKAARMVNQDLRADHEARALGLAATLTLDPAALQAVVAFDGVTPELPRLSLLLVHSTLAAEDITVLVERAADGSYRGSLPRLPMGKRHLYLEPVMEADAPGRWRLRAEDIVFQAEPVRLLPAR